MFLDRIHLLVQSGNGGNGCESYSHRPDKKIVPEGGDGGRGGRVIFRADHNAPPLASFRYRQHQIAEPGGHGGNHRKRGKNGQDLIITVPAGARLYDRERGLLIRELFRTGEEVVVLEGGRGGVGNSSDRAATLGEKGKSLDLELTLRIQADIFLVGLPNSGKSSLLNRLTGARAKEEAYPFATTAPEMGVYQKSNYEKLTLCELPSIYGASHEGRGRGNDFLKHLEEAKFILYALSCGSEFEPSIEKQFQLLRGQLEIYNAGFLQIPYAVAVNKCDLREPGTPKERLSAEGPVFYVSVQTGEGMDSLTAFLNQKTDQTISRA